MMTHKRGHTKSPCKSLFFGLSVLLAQLKRPYQPGSIEEGDAQKARPALPDMPLRLFEGSSLALCFWNAARYPSRGCMLYRFPS